GGQGDGGFGGLRTGGAGGRGAHPRGRGGFGGGNGGVSPKHFLGGGVLDFRGGVPGGGGGRAAAAGTGRYQRHEAPEAHALKQLLCDLHLERAIAARLRRERDANGVANALLKQHAKRCRRGDDAL